MSILKTIEDTAAELRTQMGPAAEKARHTADEWIDRLGEESRYLGEKMSERLSTQLAQVPDATLKKLNLVSRRKARRKMFWGLLIGLVAGALLVRLFAGEEGERRLQEIRSRMGWEEPPASATAVTGDLPQ